MNYTSVFRDIWNPFVSTLCSSSNKVDTTKCVLAAFEVELFRAFNSHLVLLKRVLEATPLTQLQEHSFDSTLTIVRKDLECQQIENMVQKTGGMASNSSIKKTIKANVQLLLESIAALH